MEAQIYLGLYCKSSWPCCSASWRTCSNTAWSSSSSRTRRFEGDISADNTQTGPRDGGQEDVPERAFRARGHREREPLENKDRQGQRHTLFDPRSHMRGPRLPAGRHTRILPSQIRIAQEAPRSPRLPAGRHTRILPSQIRIAQEAPRSERGAFPYPGELYYQVQHFRGIKRSSYRPMVE